MRGEHRHIERLMRALGESLAQEDTEQSLGISETLLILLQQHNVKEEQVLYLILDRLLADQREALLQAAHRVPPRATETPSRRAE